MSRDKQIEEMAKVIEQARIKATVTTNSMNYGFGGWYAKELYNAGYCKASDVAEEIFGAVDEMIELLSAMYGDNIIIGGKYAELKKKYTEGGG